MTPRRAAVLPAAAFLAACGAACGGAPPPPGPPAVEAEARYEGLLSVSSAAVPSEGGVLDIESVRSDDAGFAAETFFPSVPRLRLTFLRARRFPVGVPGAVVRRDYELWGFELGANLDTGAGASDSMTIPLPAAFALELASGRRIPPSILTPGSLLLDPARGETVTIFFVIPRADRPLVLRFFGDAVLPGAAAVEVRFETPPVPPRRLALGLAAPLVVRVDGFDWIARAFEYEGAQDLILELEVEAPPPSPRRLFLYDRAGRYLPAEEPVAESGVVRVRFKEGRRLEPPRHLGLTGPPPRLLVALETAPPIFAPDRADVEAARLEGLEARFIARRRFSDGRFGLRVSLATTLDSPVLLPTSAFGLVTGGRTLRPEEDLPVLLFPFRPVVRDFFFEAAPPGPLTFSMTHEGRTASFAVPPE